MEEEEAGRIPPRVMEEGPREEEADMVGALFEHEELPDSDGEDELASLSSRRPKAAMEVGREREGASGGEEYCFEEEELPDSPLPLAARRSGSRARGRASTNSGIIASLDEMQLDEEGHADSPFSLLQGRSTAATCQRLSQIRKIIFNDRGASAPTDPGLRIARWVELLSRVLGAHHLFFTLSSPLFPSLSLLGLPSLL